MCDWVRNTGVFCYAVISEINLAVLIYSYVFKKSISLDCLVDVRFGFRIKVDNLCVAAAFEVEYTVVIPAVLVITD